DSGGQSLVKDHRTKLRLRRFDTSAAPQVPTAQDDDVLPPETAQTTARQNLPAARDSSEETAALHLALSKREWLLETLERQRDLAPRLAAIERVSGLNGE